MFYLQSAVSAVHMSQCCLPSCSLGQGRGQIHYSAKGPKIVFSRACIAVENILRLFGATSRGIAFQHDPISKSKTHHCICMADSHFINTCPACVDCFFLDILLGGSTPQLVTRCGYMSWSPNNFTSCFILELNRDELRGQFIIL
jgi:hypothetical protein